MHAYKDSPDTTFIGKSLQHGYAPILERYKKAYPNKDAMGTLEFSDFAVRELGTGYAVVTGRFHLARNAAGGGDVSGIFSLIWEKTPAGWKIILDHTSLD
jgi:ketosteroid isomerase-like protein